MALTYSPIATTTVSGTSTTTITFNSFSGYTDLVLIIQARENSGSADGGIRLRFNSDTATNYSLTQMYGDGTNAASSRGTNSTYASVYGASASTSSSYGLCIVNIMNYANTTTFKTILQRTFTTSSTPDVAVARVNLWRKTPEAITSFTLELNNGANFANGSIATLYGIKAA